MTVSLIANQCMLWGGEDVPCAQILLMSLGGLDADVNAKISGKVQALLTKHFKIASDPLLYPVLRLRGIHDWI